MNEDEKIDETLFQTYQQKFKDALNDDLNTANALTVLYEVLKSNMNGKTKRELVKDFDQVLSLSLLESNEIDEDLKQKVLSMIEERKLAKQKKDFEKADEIRNQLKEMVIQIKDTREGTIFEKIN